MTVRFYSGTKNASSWAMRAWLALRAADISFEEEVVDIRRPQRFANLERVARFSPPAMVPVLVADGQVISDSLAIMEYANDMCGGRLLPADPLRRAEARSIMAWQHSGLSGICHRISFESSFYPYKRHLTREEIKQAARLFGWLEELLAGGGGPFLFGDIGLADFMLVPAAVRLSRHDIDLAPWPQCKNWVTALLAHTDVSTWLEEADRLPHLWLDEYLVPGAAVELREACRAVPAALRAPARFSGSGSRAGEELAGGHLASRSGHAKGGFQ